MTLMAAILLRDDDINYFTSVENLEEVYSALWSRNNPVPVALAVVPFQTGCQSGAIPDHAEDSSELFPIGENEELVEYLRDRISEGSVSIMQHGFSHEDFANGFEFEACPNPAERLRRGRKHLEGVFNTEISTFVPPHDRLSRSATRAVANEGLDILTSFGYWPHRRPFTMRSANNFLKLAAFRLKHGETLRYPGRLSFNDHFEHPSYSFDRDVTDGMIKEGIDFTSRMNGTTCIGYHYWDLIDEGRISSFHGIVEYCLDDETVRLVFDDELFRSAVR